MSKEKPKKEVLQIRIDSELKERFFSLARERGFDPSDLIRRGMEDVVSGSLDKDQTDSQNRQVQMSIINMLVRIARPKKEGLSIEEIKRSSLLDLYREMAGDEARYSVRDVSRLGYHDAYHRSFDSWMRGLEESINR
jgi:antitoxin component of RelBE/YafQ-DinJ toxin-antitoxin module